MDYKSSGVNTNLGNQASKIMFEASKKTWVNRKNMLGEIKVSFDDFSGLRFSNLGNQNVCLAFDGVGTKVEVAERLSSFYNNFSFHEHIAFDLFAMVCEDAAIRGGEPVLIGSILDVNTLNISLIKSLAKGMIEAAKLSRVSVINGEIAELGSRINGYGNYSYNWGAGLAWIANKNTLISGKEIKESNKIICLKEEGFRSNGFSLIRKIMESKYGSEWHTLNPKMTKDIVKPSKLYTQLLVEINRRKLAKGMVHITGGGIPEKLGRILKVSGKGAILDNIFEPPASALQLQEYGNISDEEAYKTWNMGNGILIITNECTEVLNLAKKFSIDAKICGEIINKPLINLSSKGKFEYGKTLKFNTK